jgi:hypothetical protein
MRRFNWLCIVFALGLPCAAAAKSGEAEGPPIKVMPLSEIEPPRNVPAAEWKSPYCAKWDDGCTECNRTNLDEEPHCHPAVDYIGVGVCKPRGVLCAESLMRGAYYEIESVCWRWGWVTFARPGTNWPDPMATFLSGFSKSEADENWRSDSLALGPLEHADAQRFARRVMQASGRNPDIEFERTSKNLLATFFCLNGRSPTGGGEQAPDWFELMREIKP